MTVMTKLLQIAIIDNKSQFTAYWTQLNEHNEILLQFFVVSICSN